MEKYQALVTKIYDAVVSSARWGSDAHSVLLEALADIIDAETLTEEEIKRKQEAGV